MATKELTFAEFELLMSNLQSIESVIADARAGYAEPEQAYSIIERIVISMKDCLRQSNAGITY